MNPESQLPEWAQPKWRALAKAHGLELSTRLNPFFQRGDFDGDGRPDLAVLVRARSGKLGIALLHRGRTPSALVGAGVALGNAGDDFVWLDLWSVEEGRPEALRIEHADSASGLIVFEKGRYRWRQRGD